MNDQKQNERRAETRTAIIELRDDGILMVSMKKGSAVTIEDAEENHLASARVAGDARLLVLVDVRPAVSITREARIYFADENVRSNTVAQALIIDSGVSKVIGNFFIGLNKPKFPVKLFTSEDKAVDWLKGFEK